MDIPAVVGAREASRIVTQDDWIIIDGDAGVVIVNPSPIVLEEYRFRQRQIELERARLDRLRNTPAVTLDGQPIDLLANIELPSDAQAVLDAGAMGVGLFRSEFLFMNRAGRLPGEEEQYEAYSKVVKSLAGLPVTIRTVDIGADKQLDPHAISKMERHRPQPESGARLAGDPLEPLRSRRSVRRTVARHPARQRAWQGAYCWCRWWLNCGKCAC